MEPRKFTKRQVVSIRNDFRKGFTISSIAKYWEVSDTVIHNIVYRHTYKDIKDGNPTPKLSNKNKNESSRQFSDSQIRKMRMIYASGLVSMQYLADRYGVTDATIHAIIHRKTYKDIA